MAEEKKVEVSTIGITIGKQRVELTPGEAERLYQGLRELFGKSDPAFVYVQPFYYPAPVYVSPYKPNEWPNHIWYTTSTTQGKLEWKGGDNS